MPRIVRHDQSGPIKIDPAAPPGDPAAWPRDQEGNLKKIFICACGLSARFPFCDGTHKSCAGEDPARTYTYGPGGSRRELEDDPPAASVPSGPA
ncbi:MAG: CDGSH iron-sulfur domain-containing protein [Phycisphaeraceae bacterium]|nr:CDGSH iron-sulfur domain-containing protein [Phycisphaerae bacterium]MBX3391877.1 CDGSH iron-sulfur domain-containing protein [Phycisphaeraceae bacterium]HRJ49491.1 CDGSH iron-sulfur domain-containing protein [Phycisphaerales bacterium]